MHWAHYGDMRHTLCVSPVVRNKSRDRVAQNSGSQQGLAEALLAAGCRQEKLDLLQVLWSRGGDVESISGGQVLLRRQLR